MCNAEGKMRNEKCGTTVIGPQVRSRDRSSYAVYRALPAQQRNADLCIFVNVTVIWHLLQCVLN